MNSNLLSKINMLQLNSFIVEENNRLIKKIFIDDMYQTSSEIIKLVRLLQEYKIQFEEDKNGNYIIFDS